VSLADAREPSGSVRPCGDQHAQAPRHSGAQEKNSPEGLVGVARRFVKFGGGASDAQLAWLRDELATAAGRGERAIVCSHLVRRCCRALWKADPTSDSASLSASLPCGNFSLPGYMRWRALAGWQ
jgi:hypothetical protein